MATETDEQRLARLDRVASRAFRTATNMRRSAVYRRAEAQEEWEKQQQDQPGAAPATPKTKSEDQKP